MNDAAPSPGSLDTEQNLRLLLASMRDCAVFMLDPAGRVASWNPGAEAINGYRAEEILGQHFSRFYPPQDAAVGKPERELEIALRDGRFEEVGRRLRKDGSEFWASVTITPLRDANGKLIGFGKVTWDVSARVQAGKNLRASEVRQRSLADTVIATIGDGIVTLAESGVILSVNPAFETLFRCAHDATAGRSLKSVIAPAFHDQLDRTLRDVHVAGAQAGTRMMTGLRPDGTTFPIELSLAEAAAVEDAVFVGIIRDLSEHTHTREQLALARKGEAIGELASGIAHDFNNLLTVMVGGSEDLVSGLEGRPDLKRHADAVRAAAERGADLTQRLLAYSRRQPGALTKIDCNQVLRGMRQLLRRTLREDVELRLDLTDGLAEVLVDPVQFETAVIATVRRSAGAMPGGGRITISTAPGDNDSARSVAIVIADTSTGTPAPASLEPVSNLAKASNGSLDVANGAAGTSLRLCLPTAPMGAAVPSAPAPAAPERTGLVLVAEDDPFVRSYAVACLESLGYRVIAAVDGRDALARLEQGLDPDVLFTDIVMPGGVNGWQLAEQARAQRPNLRVLYTSGYALETLAEDGTLPPAARVLNKPYRRAELGHHIQELMAEVGRV